MKNLICPECGARLIYKPSKFGGFYGCENYQTTKCKGAIGCHVGTRTPLGVPANQETRKLRTKAHLLFDNLWKNKQMKRKEAYKWLAEKMILSQDKAHIGMFNKEQCEYLIKEMESFNG